MIQHTVLGGSMQEAFLVGHLSSKGSQLNQGKKCGRRLREMQVKLTTILDILNMLQWTVSPVPRLPPPVYQTPCWTQLWQGGGQSNNVEGQQT